MVIQKKDLANLGFVQPLVNGHISKRDKENFVLECQEEFIHYNWVFFLIVCHAYVA